MQQPSAAFRARGDPAPLLPPARWDERTSVPPPLLYDLNAVDLDRVVYTREEIYDCLPHRYEFMQLDAIVHVDEAAEIAIARRDVREDEWWVKGHVPARPLLPGVLLLETAAQLAAFMRNKMFGQPGFVGFGGVDDCKFREAITPPARIYVVGKKVENRPRRVQAACQAVIDGSLVFEATITGLAMKL